MTAFTITAEQIFILAVLLLTGYFIKKKNYIGDDAVSGLSFILINLSSPAIIVTSLNMEYTDERLINGLICFFSAVAVMFFGYILALIIQKPLNLDIKERKVFLAGAILSNIIFIGLPIIRALLGDEAVFYLCFANLGFNFVAFTFVIGIFKKNGQSTYSLKTSLVSIIKTPSVIACVLGLCIFIYKITLPSLILQTLNYFSYMMSPIAMLIMGALVSRASLKEIFAGKNVYILSSLRLFFIPLAAFFLLRPFIQSETVLKVVAISAAMPVATMVSVFAESYGGCGKESSIYCIVTTMLSLFSLPLVSAIISYF